jgi:hypothetical protein
MFSTWRQRSTCTGLMLFDNNCQVAVLALGWDKHVRLCGEFGRHGSSLAPCERSSWRGQRASLGWTTSSCIVEYESRSALLNKIKRLCAPFLTGYHNMKYRGAGRRGNDQMRDDGVAHSPRRALAAITSSITGPLRALARGSTPPRPP